jgi:transposase
LDVTDEQWQLLQPLIAEAEPARREDGKGRPRRNPREALDGILWILRTGAQWADLPDRYPPHQTCPRRFQEWVRSGLRDRVLQALAQDLQERADIDLSECFIDDTLVVAKKGGSELARPSGARVRRSWQLQTALLFHSPYTLKVLLHMKSPLCSLLSKHPMLKALQRGSWETKLMTATRLTPS